MGTFRCGLLLAGCLTFGCLAMAQDNNPANPANPNPAGPVPGAQGTPLPLPDTNAPAAPPLIAPQQDLTAAPVAPEAITNAPAKKVAKPKPAAPALPTVRGVASKLDTLNMTLTVEAKGKEETFKISSKTRVFADGKPAILSDAKPGENVIVEYRNAKDKSKEALTLKFGGSAPAGEKGGAAIDKSSKTSTSTAKKAPAKSTKKSKKAKKPAAAKAGGTNGNGTATPGGAVPAPVETIPPATGNPAPPPGVTPLPGTPGQP